MREALALGPLGERQAPETAKHPGLGKSPDPSGVGTPLSSVLTYSVAFCDPGTAFLKSALPRS